MKEEKPSLVLNKKTVAHLNNLEMNHVRGGDGGETDMSQNACTETNKTIITSEDPKDDSTTLLKSLTTIFLTKLVC